ncbi:aromatic-L-amino-acid decarboxylase-like [Agrilus planipennis]|nr:aromatic-L-amino-acid decarboxylase-like [Agrilus planipennis]
MMMNWLGKLLHLPEEFLNCAGGNGGGVIQGSASESTLIALLTAKEKMVRTFKQKHPDMTENDIKGKLVAYTSDQANSSVEKAGILGSMKMRLLPADSDCILRGETLKKAIEEDRKKGLIPCYVVATLGTTGTCAFDNLEELGPICNEEDLWLHIDAAYAGSAFACPEYQHYMKGVKYATSFNFNPHKWLLVNSDCSALWVKNSKHLVDTFAVDRIYLKHKHEGVMPDYRHWQISLGRRFRALKLWFVMRIYGVEGIQKHIRTQIGLANYFEELVENDKRFEVSTKKLGLVCFRIKGKNILTEKLQQLLTERKNIYCIPCYFREKYVIRFVVCSRLTLKDDIDYAWNEICSQTAQVFEMDKNNCLEGPPAKKLKFEEDVLNNNAEIVED